MKKIAAILLPLGLITTLVYLPILVNPGLLLERGNDLQEQFWPIFYFVKQRLLEDGSLPLWTNLFFSGMPLLPDPQAPLFYLPNIIFLFLPIGAAFIVSFFLHTLLGGVGVYFCAREGLKYSKTSSLFTASLYIAAPRLAGYLEAGHYGLVFTLAWFPLVLLSIIKIAKDADFRWFIGLGIGLAGLYYSHAPTFILTIAAGSLVFFYLLSIGKTKKHLLKKSLYFALGGLVTLGLSAISLFPQIEWVPDTTRYLLINSPDVYPKWTSFAEVVKSIFLPWISASNSIWQIDTEKWLALGIIPSFLAFAGFWKLSKKLKVAIVVLAGSVSIIALNNISPLYPFLLSQKWYALMRVSTRIWFIPLLFIVFLAGFGFENLIKKKVNKKLLILVALLAVIESLLLSWVRILKPIPTPTRFVPDKVYQYLQSDSDRFRVFCTTRCLSQREAAKYGLELTEGYNTIQQINYFKHTWQMMGGYWNYYTLAIPPIGAYKFSQLQPDAASLGDYNTKYIISPHELEDENFTLEKRVDNYLIYRNELAKPRAEAPIIIYTPNHIRVDTLKYDSQSLILSEVYSPGWKAYLNGKEKVTVQETPNALRLVDIKHDTKFVDFKYQPETYKFGRLITFTTLAILASFVLIKMKKLSLVITKKAIDGVHQRNT